MEPNVKTANTAKGFVACDSMSEQAIAMAASAASGRAVPDIDTPSSCMQPICRQCKVDVDPFKRGVRLMKKAPPEEWMCSRCNSNVVGLTSLFGSWPIEQFHTLDDLQKEEFWKECGEGKRTLQAAVEKKIIFTQLKQRIDKNLGKFLPLQVWVNKCWAAEDVVKCPCEVHAQTGAKTYQVSIHTTGTKTLQEMARQEMNKLLLAPKAKTPKNDGGNALVDKEEASANEPTETDQSRSCQAKDRHSKTRSPSHPSTSRSRSDRKRSRSCRRDRSKSRSRRDRSKSRSRRRDRAKSRSRRDRSKSKSRRDRSKSRRRDRSKSRRSRTRRSKSRRRGDSIEEAVKEKILKEQAKRDAAAEKKRVATLQNDCTKILSKIGPLVLDFKKIRKNKSYSIIPTAMEKRYTEVQNRLLEYQAEANFRVNGDTTALSFTLADVNATFKAGTLR